MNMVKYFMVAVIAMALVMPAVVLAQPLGTGDGGSTTTADEDLLGIGVVGKEIGLGSEDVRTTIGSIIKAALGFLGVVAIIIVLIGGFKYMTAGGSEEKVGDARKWIISGIIGLAIILTSYAITTFVINRLVSATTG